MLIYMENGLQTVLRVQRVPGCAADGSWRLAKKRSERSRNGGNHQRTVEQLVASLPP